MKTDFNLKYKRIFVLSFIVFSIIFLSFLTYSKILDYYFTGIDTMTAIYTGRISTFMYFLEILSQPLFFNTPVVEIVEKSYRPIVALSYSMDYAVWGLNPFGYHLTNIMLHATVAVLLFCLMQLLTRGRSAVSWLSAFIFCTHPLLVENVPSVIRRFDTFTALFILASLVFFVKYLEMGNGKKFLLTLSMFSYAIALGCKEVAVILPLLVFAYLMILHFSDEDLKYRAVRSIKISFPYFFITVIYLVWRTYVIGGVGGYVSEMSGLFEKIQMIIEILFNYFKDIVYPVDFMRLNSAFSPYSGTLKQAVFMVLLIAAVFIVLKFRSALFITANTGEYRRGSKVFRIFSAVLAMLSLFSILAYPVISPYLNRMIELAYNGIGPEIITKQMNNIGVWPVETYFYKLRDLLLESFAIIFFVSLAGFIIVSKADKIISSLKTSDDSRLIVFLIFWIPLQLGIYLPTFLSGRNYLYIPVIPFSAILALLLAKQYNAVSEMVKNFKISIKMFTDMKVISFFATVFMAVSLFAYSHVFWDYGEWRDSGRITKSILYKLSELYPEIPGDSVIHIYNFPDGIESYKNIIPSAKDVVYMNAYNIESWMKLHYPSFTQSIKIESRQKLSEYPKRIDIVLKKEDANSFRIDIKYENGDNGK